MIQLGLLIILLGFLGLILRRTIAGFLISVQVLFTGAILLIAAAGIANGKVEEAQAMGTLVALVAVAQNVLGAGLLLRTFTLKGSVDIDHLKELRS